MPEGNKNSSIRIVKIHANPLADDNYKESLIIKNFGNKPANLKGWKISNSDNLYWELDKISKLLPCETTTLMSLHEDGFKNSGDTLKLIDDNNMLIQVVSWESLHDGEPIFIE